MLGWQAKIQFRFDFITPVSWVRMQNYQNPVEENVPQPHNAYQTYIYTFNFRQILWSSILYRFPELFIILINMIKKQRMYHLMQAFILIWINKEYYHYDNQNDQWLSGLCSDPQ